MSGHYYYGGGHGFLVPAPTAVWAFGRQNLAASQANGASDWLGDPNHASPVLPRSGCFRWMSVGLVGNAAGSALGCNIRLASSIVSGASFNIAVGQASGFAYYARGLYRFTAGQLVEGGYTTDGSWTGTTVDASWMIGVEFDP